MNRLLLKDIQNNFAEVVANLLPGEVVQIVSGDQIVARLMGERQTLTGETLPAARQPGSAIGTLKIISDDDEHLQDFADYMSWDLPMKLLLDTHAFLWFVLDDPQLSPVALSLISDLNNSVLMSPASYWEIAIKVSLGKYEIPGSFQVWIEQQLSKNSFEILPIQVAHAAKVTTIPFHHRDPFDRLLIAQAMTEEIPIISVDGKFDQYAVERKW